MATGNTAVAARIQSVSTSNPFKSFLRRYFYFGMGVVMSALVVAGFSRTVNVGLFHATPPRPLLLWIHGAAFSSWMVFYVLQSALVRVHRVSVHRLLGWFGAALAATMVPLGITVAVVMTRFDVFVLHQKGVEAFIGIPFIDMIAFGVLVALAIVWRKRPEYHRRLLFIATCQLMDAAIGRFDFWFNHSIFYVGLDLLIVLGMLRDWHVDGKVHKVYWYALPPMAFLQAIAIYVWRVNPVWWQGMTKAILGW